MRIIVWYRPQFIIQHHPQWCNLMSDVLWEVPFGIFVLTIFIGLITAPYKIKIDDLEKDTNPEIQKAKKLLAKNAAIKEGRMIFVGNVYWAKDINSGKIDESPYCQRCFELDGDTIHLNVFGDILSCPACYTNYTITGKPF
jgi:hypothetical protein